jgi:hypothetical protein
MQLKSLFVVMLCAISFVAQSQEDSEYDENYEFPETKTANINLGVGLGLDYGGIGGKLTFVPTPMIGIFGSIGYNLDGAGYNGGVIFRILPEATVCPYVSAFYGYNAVLVIEGRDSKTYYGPSIGTGIELHRKNKGRFWNFGVGIPIRSQEYQDDVDEILQNPNYESTEALPFTLSIGYHFAL